MVSREICSDSLCGLLEHRGAQAALILGKEINCERHWGLQDEMPQPGVFLKFLRTC